MKTSFINKILEYIQQAEYRVVYLDEKNGIVQIDSEQEGVRHLILGVVPPILIMEYYLFSFSADDVGMYKSLLQKNRDMLHGAFVVNEEGNKVLFRYTMQIENLDFNEFEAALNALGLMLQEYADKIIEFSKK